MDTLTIAEAHFAFCRMYVDIHFLGRHVQIKHKSRMALLVKNILISLLDRVHQHLVAHDAAIDKEILFIARRARVGGEGGDGNDRTKKRPGTGEARALVVSHAAAGRG